MGRDEGEAVKVYDLAAYGGAVIARGLTPADTTRFIQGRTEADVKARAYQTCFDLACEGCCDCTEENCCE